MAACISDRPLRALTRRRGGGPGRMGRPGSAPRGSPPVVVRRAVGSTRSCRPWSDRVGDSPLTSRNSCHEALAEASSFLWPATQSLCPSPLRPPVAAETGVAGGPLVLSSFTVTDSGDSAADPGSLRYAITQLDLSPDASNTITIDSALSGGQTITLGASASDHRECLDKWAGGLDGVDQRRPPVSGVQHRRRV